MKNKQFLYAFLQSCRSDRNLCEKTLRAYQSDLGQFIAYIGAKLLTDLGSDEIRMYFVWLRDRSIRDSSLRRKRAVMKCFLSFLHREGCLTTIPNWAHVSAFRTQKTLPRVLSVHDVKSLLTEARACVAASANGSSYRQFKSRRDLAILETLFETGIRIYEISSLNTSDYDTYRHVLYVRGKGRRDRILPVMSVAVIDALDQFLQRHFDLRNPNAPLFYNKSFTRLTTNSIAKIFRLYADRAGISRTYTPHCLRHTMATMLIENGADVRSVQEILGHQQVSTTEIYLHVSANHKESVLRKFSPRATLGLP